MKQIKEKRFKLRDVDGLKMCVFIVKRSKEDEIKKDLLALGGKVLSVCPGVGVSHSSMFEAVSRTGDPCVVIFAATRREDARNIIAQISLKNEIFLNGNGRAFDVDISGYLGAKALFL